MTNDFHYTEEKKKKRDIKKPFIMFHRIKSTGLDNMTDFSFLCEYYLKTKFTHNVSSFSLTNNIKPYISIQ